jgi:DNA-binding winged helix-turn-helix (wHTH) protein/tetratricopeptide (TPR) repeat protein
MAPDSGRGEQAILFAGFRLEADGSLFSGETPIHLPPRELAALRLLLANAGQIVTSAQLKKALWGDVHVTADSVPKCLSALRARLQPEDCIQTVYKRGYRFIAEVRQLNSPRVNSLPRLAITPFTVDTGVPEHLGQAIADEAISRLSNSPNPPASILARDSVFILSMRGLSAQQIGQTLHADLVLAGTLRALTAHFRLRVEMIRVVDGIQIWVEDLIVEREKLAGLESNLATRLEFRLRAFPLDSVQGSSQTSRQTRPATEFSGASSSEIVAGAELRSISAAAALPVHNVDESERREAYEVFLRGHYEWQSLERHRMQDGLQFLTRATELDPSLIAAKIDLVRLCVAQAAHGFMAPAVAAEIVHRTAESIPDLPIRANGILPSLGTVSFHIDRNFTAAQWAFSHSANMPLDPWTTRSRVMFALGRSRFDEAIALLDRAIRNDPYSPWLHARLAWAYHLSGQAGESMDKIRHALALFPENEGVGIYGSMILPFNGDTEAGLRLAESLSARQPYYDQATALHAYTLACAGRKQEAVAIVERLRWMSRQRFVSSSFNPAVFVVLGDHESALADLRTAEQSRCPWFFLMLADPRLQPLHGHPEFKELQSILPSMEAAAQKTTRD